MKRSGLLLACILLAMAVGRAQETAGVEVSLNSGYVLPSSPMSFANYWKLQYGGGVRAGFPLSGSVKLVGSLEYYRFALNESGVQKGFDTNYMRDIWIFDRVTLGPSADASSVLALSASLRVAPTTRTGWVSPYFIGGIGVMRFSLSDIAVPMTSVFSVNGNEISMTAQNRIVGGNETAFLLQGGVGVDFKVLESLNAFVEARYVAGLTKAQATGYVPLNVGVSFQL